MDKKLIFLDVDGTLIAPLSSPTPRVRRAIRQARSNGHLVFLCTGRNMPIIGPDILEIGFDGVIASAGAYVAVGDEILLDQLMPEELVQECLALFHSLGMFCRLETSEGVYIDSQMGKLLRSASPDPRNSELIRMQKELQSALTIRNYEEYPRQGSYKLCFTSASLEAVRKAETALGDRFLFVVHPFVSSTSCFNGEIIPRWISKGKAVALVCRYIGADPKDAVAFGDSMNDASMLERAGTAVAMGNACEELKALADIVCEDADHDGVARQLRRMGLCDETRGAQMRKIIFLDVDGTLTDYEGRIPPSAATAVRQARKNGHRVYICTGRSKAEVYPELWNIGLDGMIGGNGSYVEDHGRVVFHQTMTLDQCRRAVDWLHERGLEFYLESNSGLYASENFEEAAQPAIRLYSKRKGPGGPMTVRDAFPDMVFGGELYRDDLNKLSFVLSDYQDYLDARTAFPDLKVGTWGGKGEEALFGDLGIKDIDKAVAIRALTDYLHADMEDTIAFGDAKVDIPMLQSCAYGVAMGSGGPEIRAMADYVTGDVEADGLYQAFEVLGLLAEPQEGV